MLDPIATKLEHYMDLLGKRQQLVAANIANADTPGYKTRDIDFQFEFMSQLEGGSSADDRRDDDWAHAPFERSSPQNIVETGRVGHSPGADERAVQIK